MRSVFALVVFALGSAVAAPVPKELKKEDDKTRIVGTWKTERILNGAGEDPIVLHTLVFSTEGKAVALYHDGLKDVNWTVRFDSSTTPKRLSLVLDGTYGVSCECAYEFRDGRLILAFAKDDKTPPTTIAPGPSVVVHEFKRADAK